MWWAKGKLLCAALTAVLTVLIVAASAEARNLYVTQSKGAPDNVFQTNFMSIGADGEPTPLTGSPITVGTAQGSILLNPNGNFSYTSLNAGGMIAHRVTGDGRLATLPGGIVTNGGTYAFATAIHPQRDHLYLTDSVGGTIVRYDIGENGYLSPMDGVVAGNATYPAGVAISPDGQYLFASDFGDPWMGDDDGIRAYSIALDGGLTELDSSPFPTGGQPFSIAITPDGEYLYVANFEETVEGVQGFSIAADGSLSPLPAGTVPAGNNPIAAVVGPSGQNLYVVSAGSANPASAAPGSLSSFEIGPGGGLSELPLSPSSLGGFSAALAVSPDEELIYTTSVEARQLEIFSLGPNGPTEVPGISPFDLPGNHPAAFESIEITPNLPPVAAFDVAGGPDQGTGTPVSFDASASSDSDDAVATYEWDFGDGTSMTTTGPTTEHTYTQGGSFDVSLKLTDDQGCADDVSQFTGRKDYCGSRGEGVTSQSISVTDVSPPEFQLKGKGKQKSAKKVLVKVKVDETANVVVKPKGKKVKVSGSKVKLGLKKAKKVVQPGKKQKLKLKFNNKSKRKVKKLLKKGKTLKLKLQGTAADAAGNKAKAKKKVKVVG